MSDIFLYDVNGTKIKMPKFKNVPAGVIRKHRTEDEASQTFAILEAVADAKTLKVIDAMSIEELGAFVNAWQKDSGATTGE